MGQLEDFRGQLLAEDFDENVGFFARLFEKDDVVVIPNTIPIILNIKNIYFETL